MEESQNKEVKEHQTNALQSEALVYNTDKPIATYLEAVIPSLSNYASSQFQMTGPDHPVSSNLLLHQCIQPIFSPMTSLIPPATLLVPYPLVVPFPVQLPIPIPSHIDSKVFIRTPRTHSIIDRSIQTLSTICCCTNCIFPHTPSVSQDEVIDLSRKPTQSKQEHLLSASPNLALDLSVVNSNTENLNYWDDDMNGQNTCKWAIHESSGNKIVRSKDYNGRSVHSTQTVRDIVSPTETVPALFFSILIFCFSLDYMISSMKPDRTVTH